jgi:hypothetical protein
MGTDGSQQRDRLSRVGQSEVFLDTWSRGLKGKRCLRVDDSVYLLRVAMTCTWALYGIGRRLLEALSQPALTLLASEDIETIRFRTATLCLRSPRGVATLIIFVCARMSNCLYASSLPPERACFSLTRPLFSVQQRSPW